MLLQVIPQRRQKLLRAAALAALFTAAAWLFVLVIATAVSAPGGVCDLHTYYRAGGDVLAGRSPYPPLRASVIADQRQFVYPAAAAILAAGLALLPFTAAAIVFELGGVCAAAASLWLVGERRAAAYGLAAVSPVLLKALNVGTVLPYLMLLMALAWRYRDRAWPAGLAVMGLVCIKLFLWPLGVWLLVTGRRRGALVAAASTIVVLAASWAVLGFAGLADYPQMLRILGAQEGWLSCATAQLYALAGAGQDLGGLLGYATAAALSAAAVWQRRDERLSFALFASAGLAASPVVWLNYFGCVLVCCAVLRPRHVVVYALPLSFWLIPHGDAQANIASVALFHLVWLATLAWAAVDREPATAAEPARRELIRGRRDDVGLAEAWAIGETRSI